MCLRVWHLESVYSLVHEHVFGATQVPPFWQLGTHTAKDNINKYVRKYTKNIVWILELNPHS